MKVKWTGFYDEMEIASAGLSWIAKKGEPVEVPDEVGASLIEQNDGFVLAESKSKKEEVES